MVLALKTKEIKMTYSVHIQKNKNMLSGASKPDSFRVVNESGGLYATLPNSQYAEIVAFGLNNDFPQHFMGGFSDQTVDAIKKAMTASL